MEFIKRDENPKTGKTAEVYRLYESTTQTWHFASHIFMHGKAYGWVITHPDHKTCSMGRSSVMGDVVACVTAYGSDLHPTRFCRRFEEQTYERLYEVWRHASLGQEYEGPDRWDDAEQRAWDALVDFVEAHELNYTAFDPRGEATSERHRH